MSFKPGFGAACQSLAQKIKVPLFRLVCLFPQFGGIYHWGQNYYIPFFMFGGIIFGNYYRILYSIIFLGELITVM